jgi:hypothetical protein
MHVSCKLVWQEQRFHSRRETFEVSGKYHTDVFNPGYQDWRIAVGSIPATMFTEGEPDGET